MARRSVDRDRRDARNARARAIARDLARAPGAQGGNEVRAMKRHWILFAPLAIMALLFGAFLYRLSVPDDRLIESQWINKPMPLFDLPPATTGVEGLKSSDLVDGRPRSEEHTSELQSLMRISYAVLCLKKKNN